MKKTLLRGIRLTIICIFILGLLPVGIMAGNLTDKYEEAPGTQILDATATEQDNTVLPNEEASLTINNLDEIPKISEDVNINQQVVVIYSDNRENNIKSLSLNSNDIKSGEAVSERVDILEVRDETRVDELISEVEADPDVLAVGRNDKIEVSSLPNDTYIQNGDAWQFERIGETKTWDKISNTQPIVVAVIDSGLNVSHPDLQGRIAEGYDYINNKVDVVDLSGHGTMVSGCIAAVTNNGIGIAGVGGISDIKIAPYRAGGLSQGDTGLDLAYICAAIMDAANRPDVNVINMSFGGYKDYPTLKAAIEYAANAGKILVASAGNEGDSADYAGKYCYPASYDHVISVAATTDKDERAYFSQHNDQVDLAAPGLGIYTTTMNGGYSYASGTSFSAPIAAGSCAVVMAANPNLRASEVESILKETALDLGDPGKDNNFGAGLIQLDKAVIPPVEHANVTYLTHVENIGWQEWKSDGEIGGTSGKSLRMEAIQIKADNLGDDIGVEYQSHVQNIGWQDWKNNGEISGTTGQSLRMEAIKIQLAGTAANQYDIYYQVHSQNYGWLDWAKNGESAGTEGLSLRMEAIKIVVVPKGEAPPGPTTRPFIK